MFDLGPDTPTIGTRYQRVYLTLLNRIRDGELEPGQRLPTEPALAEEFGYSTTTIREALNRLRAAGFIESSHGLGWFVSNRDRVDLSNRAWTSQALEGYELVYAGRAPASARVADLLDVDEGATVAEIRHVQRGQDNRPLELRVSRLPNEIAKAFPLPPGDSLRACIEELTGRQYADVRQERVVRPGVPEEVAALEIPQGQWVVHTTVVARDADVTVLEITETLSPATAVRYVDSYTV